MKQTFLEIELKNLKENVSSLKQLLRPDTKFMAVVKSNAYGHGLVECAKAVTKDGADWFGVVQINEALELRKEGIELPILVLGYVDVDDLDLATENSISVPIIDFDYAEIISKKHFKKPLKVHIKIETGLNRLGVKVIKDNELNVDELIKVIEILGKNKAIEIEGIYSHLASVEEGNLSYTQSQVSLFKDAIQEAGLENLIKHISASAAAMILPEDQIDMVRFGIAIYGLWPSDEIKKWMKNQNLKLKPVLSFKTKIVQIKKVNRYEKIGYGCTFVVKKPMTIAVIPVGYYEGIDRRLSNKGEVLVDGRHCPIIGRVCMNMTIIDISNVNTKVGDEVVIIGKQGDEEITADEIAKKCGTINYEIASRIPSEIYRKYIN